MWQEWRGQTLPAIIDHAALSWPDNIAVRFEDDCIDEAITYRDLKNRVLTVQRALYRAGIRKGDHVGYLTNGTLRWLETFLAVLRLGAKIVPLNLAWTNGEIVQGMQLTDVSFLLLGAEHKGKSLAAQLAPVLSERGRKDLPLLRSVIVAEGRNEFKEFQALDELIAVSGDTGHSDELNHPVKAGDEAMLLLTSGSTAFPKPVIHTHESMLCGFASYADGLEVSTSDTFVSCTPVYHVGGLISAFVALLRGGTVRLCGTFEAENVMRWIDQDRASIFWGFDTHFSMLRGHPSYGKYKLASIRKTMVGANEATFDSIHAMGFEHIGSLYASSEYMGSQTFFPFRDRHDLEKMKHSHGRPTSGEIRIADPESGDWLATGEMGEICVRGPALFKGYYKLPDATAQCMDSEGFFHSGDMGLLDESGYLYFKGRYKDMVKSGGENVSAPEVEAFILMNVPGVVRAMICGTPDPKWGEAVTALLEIEQEFTYSPGDIINLCRGKLAGFKTPKKVIFLDRDEWVITPTGKIDRNVLRKLALDRVAAETTSQ